ncbi:hypothetical protein [Amycolatopsis sp. lyj-112]|uniref:hypothetical protein n=1 Tax=Amycolatopsis sp. lyj-112 TaxID=2789288 RepID=UPI00397B0B2F
MSGNEIRFDRQVREPGPLVVIPRIDGVLLTELVDAYEIDADMQPAGDAYGGLIPQYFRFGPLDEHFLGRSADSVGPKTPVLGCACGEWGCWPLLARITVTDDLVQWDGFEQPHRATRDYTGFGPFQFDRRHYETALRDLKAEIGSADT